MAKLAEMWGAGAAGVETWKGTRVYNALLSARQQVRASRHLTDILQAKTNITHFT